MRSGMLIRLTTLAALLVAVAAVPDIASAQQQPDPDSPAGVEYALPLDRVRDQAREKKKQKGREGKPGRPGASKPAPLFGAGISKGGSGARAANASSGQSDGGGVAGGAGSGGNGSSGSGSKGPRSDRSDRQGPGGSDGSSAQAGREGARGAESTVASVGDGDSQTGLLLGVVAGVLALGGLLGLGLRRGFGRGGS